VTDSCELAIIGGGILGCATARALTESYPDLEIALFEKESQLAQHQTGHNSGVIHAGLYYRPGSLKSKTCTIGREALYQFCEDQGIAFERCGKVVLAVTDAERARLSELERRGWANGLTGLQLLTPSDIRAIEPHAQGRAGLFVPQTGIVDYVQVAQRFADQARARGCAIHLNAPVTGIERSQDRFILKSGPSRFQVRYLVNCAGLQADRVARLCGLRPDVRIVPFRGEYYQLAAARQSLIKNLIYPVPDPSLPFLGVHFSRKIDGLVEAGPNAVLAFKREGYHRADVAFKDLLETFSYIGFWRLARRFWRVGCKEYGRSLSKRWFVRDLQRLVPDIEEPDLVAGGSGVRAQAVDRHGQLVDDFRILATERMVHVLNAPSPAATASMSIAAHIVDQVATILD
jgi:L-2-hydroxyglutarate oxidase